MDSSKSKRSLRKRNMKKQYCLEEEVLHFSKNKEAYEDHLDKLLIKKYVCIHKGM